MTYKNWMIVLLALVASCVGAQENKLLPLQVDVVYLASDLLQGRETGTKGEAMAAEYIAHRFAQMGLTPKGKDGTWYQPFQFQYNNNPHGGGTAESRMGKNVVGYLNNKAATTVVIGAHYDHLGQGIFGSLHTGESAIHNGADDNASGIAALIYLAEALKNGKASHNNYLFIAFSGEEMGLIGSKNFVNEPTIDLSKINYMINMDMVGKLNAEKVLVVNAVGTSPAWKDALNSIQVDGIKLNTTESGIGPSDHTSFYLKDIPCLHFFTGQHLDYHKPQDDSEKVNYEGLLSVSNFILALIETLDDDGKLAFSKTKDENEGRQAASFKVSLGVMPDYVFQGEGMRIDGVIDGRAAALAGLKNGDVIIKIGDHAVKDIYSYMDGLSHFSKGDKTKVVVKRGEEEIEVEVAF
ncbi:MAG TPA: M20/M25/M40 family metallo-hydrolase [Saprospiraceae bacterium]|nr:M20/M25/M40 family metallo-hydrolase [Saprospiraceae bacterium]HMQ84147.1 M20/M25/M40 family metallo-hydrolase [Saprospiraceae bacterium]